MSWPELHCSVLMVSGFPFSSPVYVERICAHFKQRVQPPGSVAGHGCASALCAGGLPVRWPYDAPDHFVPLRLLVSCAPFMNTSILVRRPPVSQHQRPGGPGDHSLGKNAGRSKAEEEAGKNLVSFLPLSSRG